MKIESQEQWKKQVFSDYIDLCTNTDADGNFVYHYNNRIYYMSPKLLLEIWRNKDYKGEIESINLNDIDLTDISLTVKVDRFLELDVPAPYIIKNSPTNRNPNFSSFQKRIGKFNYLLRNIVGVSGNEFWPISFLIPDEGTKHINFLPAKDRGNFSYYVTKLDHKLSIKELKALRDSLIKEAMREVTKFDGIFEKLEKFIDSKTSASIREIVPSEIFDRWYNDPYNITIKATFETFAESTADKKRKNNSNTGWRWWNYVLSTHIEEPIGLYPNTNKDYWYDNINELCTKDALFCGEHEFCMTTIFDRGSEDVEMIIPLMFSSMTIGNFDKMSVHEIIKNIAYTNQTNLDKRGELIGNLWDKVRQSNGRFIENEFKNDLGLMLDISSNIFAEDFHTELKKRFAKYPNKKNIPANLRDLTISKWDSFFTVCVLIKDICHTVYPGRVSNERLNNVISKFFKKAIDLLQDDKVISHLTEPGHSGLVNRYERFWQLAKDHAMESILAGQSATIDTDLLEDIIKEHLQNGGYGTPSLRSDMCTVFDRISSTEFQEVVLGNNFEIGHLIPTNPLTWGNVILQTKGDNNFNDNHPIKDIPKYVEEYVNQLTEWYEALGFDKQFKMASTYNRTISFLNSFEAQSRFMP